ncbi:TPA: hypothetical protein ACH3X1_015086 [Trebouxia sp. C0004]
MLASVRVLHHRQRLLRHPDGTLQSSMPTPNPYAVVRLDMLLQRKPHLVKCGGDLTGVSPMHIMKHAGCQKELEESG